MADKKLIALVVYPGFSLLELVGAQHVWLSATMMSPYQTVVVGRTTDFIESSTPLKMKPQRTFAEAQSPYALIVIGGGEAALQAAEDQELMDYVRQAGESAEILAAFSTGALILGKAGLLKGKQATTHWGSPKYLEAYGASYQRKRWVASGKIINAAGVSAGIDMALYLISKLTDEETARQVQLAIQYDPHPPIGPIDYDHLPFNMKWLRALLSLQAPFYTRKPKQLIRQGI